MQPKTIRAAKRIAAAVVVAAVLFTCIPAASATSAVRINSSCTFTSSSNSGTFANAVDGVYTTKWISTSDTPQTIDITIGSGAQVGGIYFIWSKAPTSWTLYAVDSAGAATFILEGGNAQYLTQYVNIPFAYAGCGRLRLSMTPVSGSTVDIAELSVFSPGEAPFYAPQWEPFSGRADLLTIAAHPDDEDLYLSVPAVTYADQGMKCATVFMTFGSASTSVRRYEAQESVWSLHNRWYPTMGNFQDIKTTTREDQMRYWALDDVVEYIVEQIRKYKPSVIVTHDINGEYGHGAHMLTEYATTLAFEYAGDASMYPASAALYGAWNAGKLYVHLYGTNPLNTMSLTTVLPSFGGRTVLQAISDAYNRHDSQLPGRELPTSGSYDMRKFGLFASRLGLDEAHNTMFEHVSEGAMRELNPSYAYGTVDRGALSAALGAAKAKLESRYTPQSWAAANLPSVIAAAQAVMDDHGAMQPQVDEQTALLNAAMGKLIAYLTMLRLDNPPFALSYAVGDTLNLAGLMTSAIYSDDSERSLTMADITVSGFDSSEPATGQTVTVSYTDAGYTQTTSFLVDIQLTGGEMLASAVYRINRVSGVVWGISPGTTAAQLLAGFSNGAENLQLTRQDGSIVTSGLVASGMTIKLVSGGVVTDTLCLSVLGDITGDGGIDIDDILYIRADIVGTYALKAWQAPAADVSGDGVIDINDILYIRAHILGTYTIAMKEA